MWSLRGNKHANYNFAPFACCMKGKAQFQYTYSIIEFLMICGMQHECVGKP